VRRKQLVFALAASTISVAAALGLAEVLLRLAYPQESMSPRWRFSPQYCTLAYPLAHMTHERPGRWRFVYTTNELGHRGPRIPPPGASTKPTVIVLGDSYTFGAGVNDGEEYPAVLARGLGDVAQVVNLGVGGWGLSQEIRRFHDVGAAYAPAVVVLQFSANDPEDDLNCPVTSIQDGQFQFHDRADAIFSLKRYLSQSIIQRSQVYNLFRDATYRFFADRNIEATRRSLAGAGNAGDAPPDEVVHAQLLSLFAAELHGRGVPLILISVNGQLATFPHIMSTSRDLAARHALVLYDAADWLAGMSDYASPEGHAWGTRAHAVVGTKLAEVIRPLLEPPSSARAAR
jgi:hypothetical protein